jgi:hypothetical protein
MATALRALSEKKVVEGLAAKLARCGGTTSVWSLCLSVRKRCKRTIVQ